MGLPEEQKPAPEVEAPLDPEAIAEARKIVSSLITMIDSGQVDQIAVYVGRRDGSYQTMQNRNNGRHEDAGRLLEMEVLRLGFMQREDIVNLINED